MKVIIIDFKSAVNNLKQNYKLSLLILVVFIAIGLTCGIYQKNHYQEEQEQPYVGEQMVTIDDIQKDEKYYFNAYDRIKREVDCIKIYLEYFQKVGLSQASKDNLDEVRVEFAGFYEKFEKDEYDFWNTPMSIEGIEKTIEFYNYKIEELKDTRTILETEYSEGSESDSLTNSQKQILEEKLAKINLYISKIEDLIDKFEDTSLEEISANNKDGDFVIDNRIKELNGIIESFNTVMSDISNNENYAISFNKFFLINQSEYFGLLCLSNKEEMLTVKINEALIYAKSHEGLDNGTERMYAMLTFFILFGIIVSVTIGAVYRPKERK